MNSIYEYMKKNQGNNLKIRNKFTKNTKSILCNNMQQ